METKREVLGVIARLMNEQESEQSEAQKAFDNLLHLVEEKLPAVLDGGVYTDNAGIMRQMNQILEEKEIFTIIPELVGRSVVAFSGDAGEAEKKQEEMTHRKFGLEFNRNLPMLLIPLPEKKEYQWYAVTYMNKLVPLSLEDYQCVTWELFQENIDVQKLVKGFVVYYKGITYGNQAYLYLPEQMKRSHSFYQQMKFLVTREICLKEIKDHDAFKKLCRQENVSCVNDAVELELQNVLMDAEVFYYKTRSEIKSDVECLARDSIHLLSGERKDQVQYYRAEKLEELRGLEKGYAELTRISGEISAAAREFEDSLEPKALEENDTVNATQYTSALRCIFHKHIMAEKYEKAKEDVLRLKKSGYPYAWACDCLRKKMQGIELTVEEKNLLRQVPYIDGEIARIKIELGDDLDMSFTDLKSLTEKLPVIETAKEHYYYGQVMLYEKNYAQAADHFIKAMEGGYEDAGKALVKLVEWHPDCGITMEDLAENLVTEANYEVGKRKLDQGKRKDGMVQLKIAASRNHLGATEMIADALFRRYQNLTMMGASSEDGKNRIGTLIELYSYLEKRNPESTMKYQEKIGFLYYKMEQYRQSYQILKDIKTNEAQYQCAQMCRNGKGVAKNLKAAQRHYNKVSLGYKDRDEWCKRLDEMIKEEQEKKDWYDANKSYSSSESSSSSSSDFCFITTAACLALQETKDCEQLNELRRFRDQHIRGNGQDGDDLVAEYYRIGPVIVKYIESEQNPREIYDGLWKNYILPSCHMIKKGEYERAKRIYIEMVKSLCEKYQVSVKESIMQKYAINVEA